MKRAILVAAVCAVCIDWTRLRGTVKAIDRKVPSVTIADRRGDLLTIPVDYQVQIKDKHGELRDVRRLSLDDEITLIRIPAEQPKDDEPPLAPPEPAQSGY